MGLSKRRDEETVHPHNAPDGHTTGGEEESDDVAAIPLIKRRSDWRLGEKMGKSGGRLDSRLRQNLKGYGGQKLPIVLRQPRCWNRWPRARRI